MLLLNGDCLECLRDISDNSIDLVILDLPYGQTSCNWDIKIDLEQLWIQLKRIGRPNTPFFFFTTTRFGCDLIAANPKWFRYDLVWEKEKGVGFLNARRQPMRAHEMIYVFYKNQPYYDIDGNHTKIKNQKTEETERPTNLYGTVNARVDTKYEPGLPKSVIHPPEVYGEFQPRTDIKYEPRLPLSVLKCGIDREKEFKHSTQKPVALLEWIIKYYSKEGDTVLDPTMGSGSTGVACNRTGRNFIGIEKDASIFETANNRINSLG
jgi:site-specific DNA-methyltransferase (adenine-specific)